MKKIISILAMILILCLTAACFTACGKKKPGGGDGVDNVGGSEDGGSETVKSEEEVISAIGDTFYFEISSSLPEEEDKNVTVFARKGDYKYYKDDDGASLSKKVGDLYNIYEEVDGVFNLIAEGSEIDSVGMKIDIQYGMLLSAQTGSIDYTSKKDINFVGRSATEYTNRIDNSANGITAIYNTIIVIDKQTGACLKNYNEMNVNGQKTSGNLEVVKMKLNSSEVQTFLGSQIAKIA